MKLGIRAGKSYKEQYTAYKVKNTFLTNKIRKLEKHCKDFEDDDVALGALERALNANSPYKRNIRSRHAVQHIPKKDTVPEYKNNFVYVSWGDRFPPIERSDYVSVAEKMQLSGLISKKRLERFNAKRNKRFSR